MYINNGCQDDLHTSLAWRKYNKHNPLTQNAQVKQGLDRTAEFQEDDYSRFQENRHTKVVRSALRTGRL
jgi:hypothetical protein